jgi:hypothetical protein
VDEENALLADDLRQRMNRKGRMILGLSFLGLGVPVGAGCVVLVLLLHLSAVYGVALSAALFLLVALVSVGLMLMQKGRMKRSLALLRIADDLGLAFKEVGATGLLERLRDLEMFSTASGIAASNVLSGQVDGIAVTAMDCVVATGQATFESTVFTVRNVRAPDFYLTPRDFLSRGSSGIDIPKQPEFNKQFLVRGEDSLAIRRAFNAEVIEACLAEKNQNVEVRQPLFVVMRRGGRLPIAQYHPFLLNCVLLAKALGISGARSG